MKPNSCACYGSNQIHECYCNLKNNNMKSVTAVEWLVEQLSSSKYIYNLIEEIECQSTIVQPNIFNQAKAMEKEQIIKAYEYTAAGTSHYGEQYYNETYNKTI